MEATTAEAFCLLLVAALAGCDAFTDPEVCHFYAAPGISVTVRHAETDEPIDDALAIAKDRAFADSARSGVVEGDPRAADLAEERPGTYEVTVEKGGFNTWSRSDVKVTGDECHVNTVELTARLAPLSS